MQQITSDDLARWLENQVTKTYFESVNELYRAQMGQLIDFQFMDNNSNEKSMNNVYKLLGFRTAIGSIGAEDLLRKLGKIAPLMGKEQT